MIVIDYRGDVSVIEHEEKWFMRLASDTIAKEIPEFPRIWYVMTGDGWRTVSATEPTDQELELEAFYQENVKGKTQ